MLNHTTEVQHYTKLYFHISTTEYLRNHNTYACMQWEHRKRNFFIVHCGSCCLYFSEKLHNIRNVYIHMYKMELLPHQNKLFLSKIYFLIHCGDKQEKTF